MVAILAWVTAAVSVLSCSHASLSVEAKPVTLTHRQPVALVPVESTTATSAPATLELSVTRVQNPRGVSLMLVASLEPVPAPGTQKPLVTRPIGTATLYPADQPGKFILAAGEAFKFLKNDERTRDQPLRLRIELRRLHPEQEWTDVEVTVAAPMWKVDSGQEAWKRPGSSESGPRKQFGQRFVN